MRQTTERRRALVSRAQKKALLDATWPASYPNPSTYANTTARSFTPRTIVSKITRTNYCGGASATYTALSKDSFTVAGASGYGVAFVTNLTPGKRYRLSGTVSGVSSGNRSNIYIMYYASDGTYGTASALDGNRQTEGSFSVSFTASASYEVNLIFFVGQPATFSNVRLEEAE